MNKSSIAIPDYRSAWMWLLPLLCFGVALCLFVSDNNSPLFQYLNGVSHFTGDWLWQNLTVLADGLFSMCLCAGLLRLQPRMAVSALLGSLIAAIIVQSMKYGLMMPRPPAVLGDSITVIGKAYKQRSFPSGHSATAFVLAGAWVFYQTRNIWRYVAVLFAALVAFSRIAVGVHWPLDVLVGSAIGWLSAYVGAYLVTRYSIALSSVAQLCLAVLLLVCALSLLVYSNDYPRSIYLQYALAVMACYAAAQVARTAWIQQRRNRQR